jgi:GTP-binding protein Era
MNELMQENISIVTSKAQTTRHKILGVLTNEESQIIFNDTPGILEPKYKLQELMVSTINAAFEDADVIVYVTDVVETPEKFEKYIEKLRNTNIPVVVAINKIDLSNQSSLESSVLKWSERVPNAEIFPISAKEKFNIENLLKLIKNLLPEGPLYYPEDTLTDKSERFFISEIIREKILMNYQKEIPYSVEVDVESFKEEEKIVRIESMIYVSRKNHKSIIIGKEGKNLKKVGTDARIDIEKWLNKKVYLNIFVKVKENWKDDERFLKGFGYS